jgi:hypothetical protein
LTLSALLWVAAFVVVAAHLVAATNAVKSATGDTEKPYDFIGLPILTGFRNGDRFGVHLEWGTLVLLTAPILLGLLLVSARLSRARRVGSR